MSSNGPNRVAINLNKAPDQLLIDAMKFEQIGNMRAALEIGREIVKKKPAWAHGHYAVGSALCGLGMLDEADSALKKAIARNPNLAGVYTRQAEVLNRLGHYDLAIEAVDKAISLTPDDPRVRVVKAMVVWLGGHPEEAYAFLDETVRGGTGQAGASDPNLRSVHAAIAGQIGKLDEGIEHLEAIVQEADDKVWADRFMHSSTLMHLSKLYDKAGRYDDAFSAAQRAGAMRHTGYEPEEQTHKVEDRIRVWSKDRLSTMSRSRVKSEKPVFIVGMPRSGTSLIEQIIASHPLAYGCGEMVETYRACIEIDEPTELQPDRLDVVSQLTTASLDRHGRRVLKTLEKAAKQGSASGSRIERITDKLPNNYEHVGMISVLFPGAKIIHCKRNALDTCISCFLLDFVGDRNHGYSYDLSHMAHQYKVYERYIEHWREASPIEMLEVEYESLVETPESGAREIIEYIGLDWDDGCAQSHKTKRSVSTLSSDQVRKPMYTSSVARWKNYEQHIGDLIRELGIRD